MVKHDRRRATRVARWHRTKQIRAIEGERRALLQVIADADLLPLERPYQRGWDRFFVWSEEARRKADFEDFEGLLCLFQWREWSRYPDFRQPRWLAARRTRLWSPRFLWSPKVLLGECRSTRWPKYFEIARGRPVTGVDHLRELIGLGWGGLVRFRHPEWVVPRIEPHIVTHRRVIRPEVESRLAEIEAWIGRQGGCGVIAHALGRRRWRWPCDRQGRRAEVDRVEVREELERRGFARAFRVSRDRWGATGVTRSGRSTGVFEGSEARGP